MSGLGKILISNMLFMIGIFMILWAIKRYIERNPDGPANEPVESGKGHLHGRGCPGRGRRGQPSETMRRTSEPSYQTPKLSERSGHNGQIPHRRPKVSKSEYTSQKRAQSRC